MNVVLIGAGGHGRVVLAAARTMVGIEIIGFLDDAAETSEVDGIRVIGPTTALDEAVRSGAEAAVVTVGSVRPGQLRPALFERARSAGLDRTAIVHASAVIAPDARVGAGSVVLAAAVVNPGARIGANVIVNTGAIVEHDCEVGDHTHISPRAVLGGAVRVGTNVHIGIGATVIQGVRIGDGALVGAGAVVIRDVPNEKVVVGVPARPMAS